MLRQDGKSKVDDGFVSQILFPAQKLSCLKSHAFLIGWNLDNFRCCISFAVELPEQQFEQIYEIIRLSCKDQMKLLSSCSKSGDAFPVVLGEFVPGLDVDHVPDASRRMEGIWITLTTSFNSGNPKLHSLYSLGCLYNTSCYLIEYSYVDTDNLLCLKPEQNLHADQAKALNSSQLVSSELDFIVAQINASCDLENCIRHNLHREVTRDGIREGRFSRVMSLIASVCVLSVSVPSWMWYSLSRRIDRALHHKYEFFYMGTLFANWLGLRGTGSIDATGSTNDVNNAPTKDATSTLLGAKTHTTSNANSNALGISICDISLCAAHLVERITRFEACFRKCAIFPFSWSLPASLKQSLWVSIYSFLIVLWVDVFVGCIVGVWVFHHAKEIVMFLEQTCDRAQKHFILDSLVWFSQSPGGVKLNSLVTTKVGAALKAIVGTYHTVLVDTKALHLPIVKFVGCFGVLGLTSQLVLLVDVMRLATLHIAATHRILAFFHQQQLQLLYSLSLLFQGEKRNSLRRRVDTCEYDQAQLLFGTVLFAVALFLFPSFAAFYYLFAFAQFGVVLVQYLLWSTAVAIKEFPLYTLGLYFTSPALLSQGLQFSILHVGGDKISAGASPGEFLRKSEGSAPAFFEHDRDSHSRSGENQSTPRVAFFQDVNRDFTSKPLSAETEEATLLVADGDLSQSGSIRGILKTGPVKILLEENTIETDGRRRGSSNTVHFDLLTEEGNESEGSVEDLLREAHRVETTPTVLPRYGGDSVSIISPNSFGRGGGASSPVGESSPVIRRRSPAKESNATSRSHNRSDNSTVLLRLLPRMATLREVFSGYFPYMQYVSSEKGFMLRLLQGVFLGRPALDIQLIHATASLAHNKALAEQSDISAVFAAAASQGKVSAEKWRGRQHVNTAASDLRGSQFGSFNANCFRPPESSGTVKNRKGVSKTGPPLMFPNTTSNLDTDHPTAVSSSSSLNFSVVYDLPLSGFSVQTSFWESLRLARSDGETEDDAWLDPTLSPPSDDCLQVFAQGAGGGESSPHLLRESHSTPSAKRINRRQKNLSSVLLYSVLITSALSLLLVLVGSAVFITSLVPVRWTRLVRMSSIFLESSNDELQKGTLINFPKNNHSSSLTRPPHSGARNASHALSNSPTAPSRDSKKTNGLEPVEKASNVVNSEAKVATT